MFNIIMGFVWLVAAMLALYRLTQTQWWVTADRDLQDVFTLGTKLPPVYGLGARIRGRWIE